MAKETGIGWKDITMVVAVLVALGSIIVVAYSIHTMWAEQSMLISKFNGTAVGEVPSTTISVTSSANVSVTPDVGYMSLSITTNSSSSNESQRLNAIVADNVRTKLAGLGLGNSSVETTSYSVQPVYTTVYVPEAGTAYNNTTGTLPATYRWKTVITGYQTVQDLQVNVSDTELVGNAVDAAVSAGGNYTYINDVWFGLSPATAQSAQQQALEKATRLAYAKAATIANETGEQITFLKTITEQGQQYAIYPYAFSTADFASGGSPVPTQINPGKITVSETVDAVYTAG